MQLLLSRIHFLLMREFDLLQHVYAANPDLGRGENSRVLIPPGDDMAMLQLHGTGLLVAVDQLVDGRHFQLETTPIELIGRKAVARSLSDIAAMAAKPLATLVAVTLPPDFGSDRATSLFDAMREAAELFHCPLVGGDIAFHGEPSHPLVCSVTVLAETVLGRKVVRRAGAQVGDIVYVTGSLGGSLEEDGGGKHLTFTPRIAEALLLSEQLGDRLHAMIDISDGLGRDASHIAELSRVRIQLHADRIPAGEGIDWRRAVSDGEDYELFFAATGAVASVIGDVPVTAVGEVIAAADDDSPLVTVLDGNLAIDVTELGWQHSA